MSKNIQIDVYSLADLLPKAMPEERKNRISVQKQAIYAHRNQLLSDWLDKPICNADIQVSAHGKPYLPADQHFHFNHSHSRHHYAITHSSRVADLGVDIEDLDRQVRFNALAKHAFHPDEYTQWEALEFDREYWFKVWTVKEAVLKASGLGIRINLNELNTQAHPQMNGGLCSHPQIGVFAYQSYTLPHAMLSAAWRTEYSCKGFRLPVIQLHTHI